MTSTKFNIGLNESSRNSSRVLRPPGGGHTDIFGTTDDAKVRKYHGRNASSILEGTNTQVPETTNVSKPMKENPTKESPTEPLPQKDNAPAAPQPRGRVPPGGFSSGLW